MQGILSTQQSRLLWKFITRSGFVAFLIAMVPSIAFAQRPFLLHDPLYRSEQPQRVFFGGYALSAEVAYRTAGSLQGDGLQAVEANPFGLSFRLDYQLSPRLDLSGILDAAGNTAGRGLSLSWLIFKYYERSESASFALRLAVDPSLDGRAGFPQIDVAWLSSSILTPLSSTEFAFGVRRVRLGYEQWVLSETLPFNSFQLHDSEIIPRNNLDVIYTRAFGWELHMMFGYNFKFDPAGSNIFVSLLGQAGSYDLLETSQQQEPRLQQINHLAGGTAFQREITTSRDYLGGVIWARAGLEFNRPNYQILPFIGLPVHQWIPESGGDWPRSRRQIGVRFMLR